MFHLYEEEVQLEGKIQNNNVYSPIVFDQMTTYAVIRKGRQEICSNKLKYKAEKEIQIESEDTDDEN